MDNGSKRRGRPKAQPQTGPLVLEGSHARVKIEIEIPEGTADELKEYARWVELSSAATTTDAMVATVDYALRDVFKRDRLWQEQRRKGAESGPPRVPKAPPAASAPASLPPPNGTAASRGTADRGI
jgi:hypothetical protein